MLDFLYEMVPNGGERNMKKEGVLWQWGIIIYIFGKWHIPCKILYPYK